MHQRQRKTSHNTDTNHKTADQQQPEILPSMLTQCKPIPQDSKQRKQDSYSHRQTQ